MAEVITNFVDTITTFLARFGFISGFLLLFLESIIPVLPLSVFIAINVLTYGSLFGFLLSWLGTICGCMTSFYISRYFTDYANKKMKKNKKIKEFRKFIDKVSFTNLVIIFAIPFTPAFIINIAAGLSHMSPKRYLVALIIGKAPMVYFWAFIGKSLSESLTDISVLAKVGFMIFIAYLVGRVANTLIKE